MFSIAEKGERDMVVLRHEIIAKWADGRREFRGINLVNYGSTPQDGGFGYSAMAKTVGYPAAIAAKMVLDGMNEFTSFVCQQCLCS